MNLPMIQGARVLVRQLWFIGSSKERRLQNRLWLSSTHSEGGPTDIFNHPFLKSNCSSESFAGRLIRTL